MRAPLLFALLAAVPTLSSCASSAPTPPVDATPMRPQPPPEPAVVPPAPSMSLADTGIEASWMDPAVDPCQDYFAYACGGFVKTAVIPADRASWGTTPAIDKANEDFLHDVLEKAAASASDPLTKKIGDYYAACMDEDAAERTAVAPLKPMLDAIAKVTDAKSLAVAITTLHANTIFPLFDLEPIQDFKDATKVIGGFDQKGIGLPDRDYYLKDEGNTKDVREFYFGHVGRMFALLGMKPAEVKAAVADVTRIETKIAKLQQDKVTRRDPYKVYHPVDRAGLAKLAKTFPWDAYLKEMGLEGAQSFTVTSPEYLTGIDALMHEEKAPAWKHYLTWQVLHEGARKLTKAFVNESFSLRQKVSGQKELEPRWKRCVRSVDQSLGELLAQPYVAAKFAGDSKDRAKDLVTSIHAAMRAELDSLAWMDDTTRAAAITKLSKINDKVGYPDRFRSYDFEVSRTAHAANVLAADRFEQKRLLAKIGKPVDRTEWGMTAPTVNAYYDPSMNEIVLPAGELQPPFFGKDFYAPINIGDEGANTIGHEITHGFDDEGSQFDGDGNLRDWWTKTTKTKFEEATKCVQDQYSGYDAIPGVKLDGALTSGENIADIGGVKLGYAALMAWEKAHPEAHRNVDNQSDEKLFFLAYAQGWCSKESPELLELMARSNPHSPARWRVNGPMADVPAFAQAYQCKAGTPMNNGKVCSVW